MREFLIRLRPTGDQVAGVIGLVAGIVTAWIAYLIADAGDMTSNAILFAIMVGVIALALIAFGITFLITTRDPDDHSVLIHRAFRPFWQERL